MTNFVADLHCAKEKEAELISWLRLARTSEVGPKTFFELVNVFGSSSEAILHLGDMARAGGRKQKLEVIPASDAIHEVNACQKSGASIVCAFSEYYPKELLAIADPPPVLTVKGNVELLLKKKIAIIGARNASINGITIATQFATDLAKYGYVIVAGLARGIDAAVHIAALDTGTIGVIAGGINHIYPQENKRLFHDLYQKGLVVTEYKIGSSIAPHHFTQRNRIISGLSEGVIIIEAAKKSGTLITSRLAAEQGREVFAVPGSPLDVRSSGTNSLIKNGAILVECAEDVIAELDSRSGKLYQHCMKEIVYPVFKMMTIKNIPSEVELAKYRSKILQLIPYHAVKVEDLERYMDIDYSIVNFLILELELAGKVTRAYGNKVMRVAGAD